MIYIFLFGITNTVFAEDYFLSWTPSATNIDGTPLTDLAGYKVYYGTTSGGYSSSVDVGNVTSTKVGNLAKNVTYYFAVTAYDTAGNESIYSNEVYKLIPDLIPPTGSFSINNNAAYTNSSAVILSFSCSDLETECTKMQFSEDGTTWTAWENYAPGKIYILSNMEGTKTFHVKYMDYAGNTSAKYTRTITLDSTSPVISGVSSSNIGINKAAINWATNESATSQIDYGTTAGYGLSTALYGSLITNHGITISGLKPSTTYHFRVKSKDKTGNNTLSGDNTFTTAIPPDTTAPVISGVTISNITTTDAIVSWTTGEASTSQIKYGTNSLYGSLCNPDNNLTTFHLLILSGLTPNTTYKLRVMSVDQAGNQGVSQEYSLTTLRTMQPETPARIMDLRVRPGSSSKNSLILDWTATGADGTEGTATRYDLRISESKIIEDGITPLQGEINFSKALNITGVKVPAAAGSSEYFQVNQLSPNSVYFFSIKAIDEKGNVSPISNIINGDNVPPLPVTALLNGFSMISIPLSPTTSNAQTLLSPIVGSPVVIYWWRAGSFIPETNIVPGYGYILKSPTDNAVLNISGTVITDTSRAIPLQAGWNMIGNPYTQDVQLINTYIRNIDTGELKTYENAVIAGWVNNALYIFDGAKYSYVMYNNANLRIWQGYWLVVLKTGRYELVIYKPS